MSKSFNEAVGRKHRNEYAFSKLRVSMIHLSQFLESDSCVTGSIFLSVCIVILV